ncbi:MAG: TetR/AcrR family transcriptional regulator [Xanthomonadales bacterium]|nr:TetR/AcrR family transcriptional regulator [Xanthomonadales bacterium]
MAKTTGDEQVDGPLSAKSKARPSAAANILAAAAELFAERGFSGCSMQDIASNAKVSKANVFHHFGSKEKLYQAVLRSTIEESGIRLSSLVQDQSTAQARTQRVTAAHLQHLLNRREETHLLLRELFEANPLQRDAMMPMLDNNFGHIVKLIADGQQRGEFRSDVDAANVALLLVGGNVMFFLGAKILTDYLSHYALDDANVFSNDVANVLLNGLLKAPKSDN